LDKKCYPEKAKERHLLRNRRRRKDRPKMHIIENNFKLWIVLKWIKLGLNMGITSTW